MITLIGVLLSGCSSFGPSEVQCNSMLEAYKVFGAQQRMGDVIHVKGDEKTPATVTLTGAEVTVSTPLPTLQAMQPYGDRQWDAIQHCVTEAGRLATWMTLGYFVKDMGGIGASSTTNNTYNGVQP